MYFLKRNLILQALRLFLYTTIQKYNRTESIPGKYIVAFEVGPSTDNIHYGHKQWAKHFFSPRGSISAQKVYAWIALHSTSDNFLHIKNYFCPFSMSQLETVGLGSQTGAL